MGRYSSDRERRRRTAETLYELETGWHAEGDSDFLYDEVHDLFRFPDGRFAFSREWADVKGLRERGYFG